MYEFTFDFLLIEVIGECGPSHSREREEGGRAEGLIVVVLIERERIFSQSSRTHARRPLLASLLSEKHVFRARVCLAALTSRFLLLASEFVSARIGRDSFSTVPRELSG